MGPTQQFQQQVIQKYGWCANYDTDENGYWFVDVVVGFNDARYHFQSTSTDPKKGKEVVSSLALETLAKHIAIEEAKPVLQLTQVFKDPIRIYDSKKDGTWEMFWENKPAVVGIDAEGNQKSPPVLVQISTDEYTILEVPRRGISSNLERLLDDDSILKVFCDNFSNRDKKCLGIHVSKDTDLTKPPIIDIEILFGSISGRVKVPRGLSRLVTMSMPELNVRLVKPPQTKSKMKNIGRFAMIEQGKAQPLNSIHELSKKEKQYAALDSWCTLQAYRRIKEAFDTSTANNFKHEAAIQVVAASIEDDTATATKNIDKLKSDPEALAELLLSNQSLTCQLEGKTRLLEEANNKIEDLQNQLADAKVIEESWDGPGSDDDTVHPIGSARRKSKSKNEERRKNKAKNGDDDNIIGSVLAVGTADQPKVDVM